MAQQTRIDAMLPYYERFMAALPDLESLARCDDEQLFKSSGRDLAIMQERAI